MEKVHWRIFEKTINLESDAHVNNACKYKAYLESKLSKKTVLDYLSEGHRLVVEKNRDK